MHFARGTRKIFTGINMKIPRGGICAIMGPSGTGKTTLLKIIGAQLKPAQGTVLFDGKDIHKMSRRALFEQRKRMGMLFQSGALLTDLSVYDNVAYPLREHTKLPERLIRHLVLTRLHAVGLRGARDLFPAELSGGMARRVALARALMLDPTMIMYDEPFTGQDPISMGVLIDLLHTVNDALGLTSIIVSHDVKETLSIADHVFIVSDGVVIEGGTPDEIQHSESPWVRQFIEGQADGPVPFQFPADDYDNDLLARGGSHA
jgi:phospholipid/cholesterol/gamma-HCH transport system ATP-binding protein